MSVLYADSWMSKRSCLADQVPLRKPYTIQLAITGICNFQCEFCPQSLPEGRAFSHAKGIHGHFSIDLLRSTVDNIKSSFGHIKQVILTGQGEPLLNPDIVDIIAYIADNGIAERISLITNGSCLTKQLGEQLVDAGLTHLRISLNGLSDQDFLRYCGTRVNFQKYVETIRYLYAHKKQMSIYIKIMNYMVDTVERRDKFFQIFEPACDIINIENLVNTCESIDFQKITKETEKLMYTKTTGEKIVTKICSLPFYSLAIDQDGYIWPCCNGLSYSSQSPAYFGNIKESAIADIWTEKFLPFQRKLLDGISGISGCNGCPGVSTQIFLEDVLDDEAERLKIVYEEKLSCLEKENT